VNIDLISEFYGGSRFFGAWSSPQRYGRQYQVETREEVLDYIHQYECIYNCGISTCTFINHIPHLLYLPFDFDSKDLKASWDDAMKLYNFMVDSNYDVTIHYSGYRGFHVLVSVVPSPYSKPQIRALQKFFKRVFNLETCDKQIFGDIRRLIRIPETLHCGKFTKEDGKWEREGEGGFAYHIKSTEGELLDINDVIEENDIDLDYTYILNEYEGRKPIHPYPCVEKYMNNEEPPQIIRYSYVAYLSKMGKSPEEIFYLLKEKHYSEGEYPWLDWDDEITMNQINHITGNSSYNPLRCNTLQDMGYCYEDCIYNLDSWLRKVKK